jgi:hypothetical protein
MKNQAQGEPMMQLPPPKPPLFEAEVIFLDLSNVRVAITQLNGVGFDVEVLDWVDPEGTPCIWLIASCEGQDTDTDIDLWGEVQAIVEPLGGGCDMAGTSEIRMKDEYRQDDADDPRIPELRRAAAGARQRAGLAYRVYPAERSPP